MASEHRTQFDYLLNAMERAGQSGKPADNDYYGKRMALFAYVRDLERRATETSGETEAQREEVCAAWADLPDALRGHPGLKRLYRALGGIDMERIAPKLPAVMQENKSHG